MLTKKTTTPYLTIQKLDALGKPKTFLFLSFLQVKQDTKAKPVGCNWCTNVPYDACRNTLILTTIISQTCLLSFWLLSELRQALEHTLAEEDTIGFKDACRYDRTCQCHADRWKYEAEKQRVHCLQGTFISWNVYSITCSQFLDFLKLGLLSLCINIQKHVVTCHEKCKLVVLWLYKATEKVVEIQFLATILEKMWMAKDSSYNHILKIWLSNAKKSFYIILNASENVKGYFWAV